MPNNELTGNAILNALELGYRSIDTAFSYYNEEEIGKGLKEWFSMGNRRDSLFITNKVILTFNKIIN